jgi:hypothetical protein
MWERGGGYERVEVRRGEVRKWTDVPLHLRLCVEILMYFPTVIAVVVTLPLDQILELIVPHSAVKELFNCVFVLTIDECWWWWGAGR